jgi:G:T-mismatch repair DNA endonuclease (very short patch repair protein)
MKKLIATEIRDIKNAKELQKLGWEVITIWECQTYSSNRIKRILETILF